MPATAYIVDTLIGSITSIGAVDEFINPHCTEQWGLTETNEYGTAWVIFPIAFNMTIPIVLAIHNGLDAVSAYISSDNRNAQQTAIVLRKIVDNSQQSGWGVGWVAIGY